MTHRPVVLAVLDGWGCSDDRHGNAIAAARTPAWDALLERYPHSQLDASGEAVGLPKGIMGNSEVGHINLGSGRVVPQGLVVIDEAIASGEFDRNPVLVQCLQHVRESGGTLHLMGLLSDGCVHSSLEHLFALIDAAAAAGVKLAVHAFLDGRDTPPRSAHAYVERLMSHLHAAGRPGALADLCGRYYGMDRDGRWERTHTAYELLTHGRAPYRESDAAAAIDAAYARGEDDEFVKPTILGAGAPVRDGDACIFFNFRPDRARQLTAAFDGGITQYDRAFEHFRAQRYERLTFATMTKYDEEYPNPVLFGPRPQADSFGEVLAHAGLRQLRLAETEKYAHVTYFFNGGREEQFEGEDRTLIPSDRSVATYDLAPAMRAREITDAAIEAIASRNYDAIVMNYANADMVGHTGKWDPTIEAIEVLDGCIGRLAEAVTAAGGLLAITADHGNAEAKLDAHGHPLTAHTSNPVPFVLVASNLHGRLDSGKLGDVAPTLLALMHLPTPSLMTGTNLFHPG